MNGDMLFFLAEVCTRGWALQRLMDGYNCCQISLTVACPGRIIVAGRLCWFRGSFSFYLAVPQATVHSAPLQLATQVCRWFWCPRVWHNALPRRVACRWHGDGLPLSLPPCGLAAPPAVRPLRWLLAGRLLWRVGWVPALAAFAAWREHVQPCWPSIRWCCRGTTVRAAGQVF